MGGSRRQIGRMSSDALGLRENYVKLRTPYSRYHNDSRVATIARRSSCQMLMHLLSHNVHA